MKINGLVGWIIIVLVWQAICSLGLINGHILPSPIKVVQTFLYLWTKKSSIWEDNGDFIQENVLYSLRINFAGYIISILTAIPVGFVLGLNKTLRKTFSSQINALRFIPITALGGIFVAITGISIYTKINFLAFGIWVYLVPVIVQRIEEVTISYVGGIPQDSIHMQMMKTLGGTFWHKLKYVVWPGVTSRLSDDIRILVGISWTYVVVAEMKNIEGGIGSMIFLGERQSNIGIVYVGITIIVIIGIFQDKIFKFIDWLIFRFKYT